MCALGITFYAVLFFPKNLQEEMSALDFLDYDEDEEEEDDDNHEEESGIINDDQSRTVVVHLWVKTLLKVK